MANFVVRDRASARIPNDFVIDVADPAYTPTDDEKAFIAAAQQTLDDFASCAAADVGYKLRDTLLATRAAWRSAKVGELRAVAGDFASAAIDVKTAADRCTAIARELGQDYPFVAIVDAKPVRFAGEFAVELTSFVPDAGEQAYLDRQKHLIDDLAADEADDVKANYSDAGLEARRAQRKDALDRLRKNFSFWREGTSSDLAAANVSFVRGRYSGQRERLARKLFTVTPVRGKDGDKDFNVDIEIKVASGLPPPDNTPTSDQQDLFVAINKADMVIGTVCRQIRARAHRRCFAKPADDKRGLQLLGEFIDKLAGIARLGLEGPHSGLAKQSLASLRDEFVAREAEEILNRYVRRLGLWAGGFAVFFLLFYVMVRTQACADVKGAAVCNSWWDAHKTFLLAAAGASIGTWASFSVRQINLTFEQLATPEEELLDAPMRIIFVVVLTMAACLLFWTGAINLRIGDLNTEPAWFIKTGTVAMLIGFFCGLSERALASAIAGRASAFVGGVAGGK
jgi:hypothetical protein